MYCTVVRLGQSVEPLAVGPGFNPSAWTGGAHSLWRDTLLNLDIGERVLPQSEVSDFVDSLWEALPFLRSGWKWCGMRERLGWWEGRE